MQNIAHHDETAKALLRGKVTVTFRKVNFSSMCPVKLFRERTPWVINFIRKEKVYTKLKYSRTPSYDIVSAGVAALFAGLLGFLICEKFGFELLDGGDFLFLALYLIGVFFSLKLLVRIFPGSFISFFSLLLTSMNF